MGETVIMHWCPPPTVLFITSHPRSFTHRIRVNVMPQQPNVSVLQQTTYLCSESPGFKHRSLNEDDKRTGYDGYIKNMEDDRRRQ